MIHYRDLTTIEECRRVVDLERVIWGPAYDDVVPVPILIVTIKRGGLLVGAFDGDEMVGFVYSLAAFRNGRRTHWSHMLGVVDSHRRSGAGRRLKLEQRQRALDMGLDLIEWTYDPLQALNARLNFTKLGIVVAEYEENIYGESASPLHRGTPTDRFVAEWWIRSPRVERRIDGRGTPEAAVFAARTVNATTVDDRGLRCGAADLSLDGDVIVEIPTGFTVMQLNDPGLALEWRLKTRAIFSPYFARGYRAVEFRIAEDGRRGQYLLSRSPRT